MVAHRRVAVARRMRVVEGQRHCGTTKRCACLVTAGGVRSVNVEPTSARVDCSSRGRAGIVRSGFS